MKEYDLRAQRKYNKKALRRYGISFNKLTEPEIVAWLDSKPNMQGYIRELILKDMSGQK